MVLVTSIAMLFFTLSSICVFLTSYGIYYFFHSNKISGQDILTHHNLDIQLINYKNITINITTSFDARIKWPQCTSIGKIWDQGACASCWAISAASVMTDRLCIQSGGKIQVTLSPQQLISCCENCTSKNNGEGCNGGDSEEAWKYWLTNGLVAGGDFGSKDTCLPYKTNPCCHRKSKQCSGSKLCSTSVKTPKCTTQCEHNNKTLVEEPKYFGSRVYWLNSSEDIQKEIILHGPVQAKFFFNNKFPDFEGDGLYDCEGLQNVNFVHSIKIIGWNTTNDGTPYWLCVNSYNTSWGENGLFRIRKGDNLCSIEENVVAGIALINNTQTT